MTTFACPAYDDTSVQSNVNSKVETLRSGLAIQAYSELIPKTVFHHYVPLGCNISDPVFNSHNSLHLPQLNSSAYKHEVTVCSSIFLNISQFDALDIFSTFVTKDVKSEPSNIKKPPPIVLTPPISVIDAIKLPKAEELEIKMHINKQIGQVCDSWSQVRKVSLNLKDFISSKNEVARKAFSYEILVQKMFSQAETQCALQKRSSFPLAATAILLFNYFPEFMDIFIIKLKERCPFIEFGSSCKLKANDPRFLETITGLVHFYAAVIVYSFGTFSKYQKRLDISDGWKFVANFLNSKPQSFTSIVLCAFLDIASHSLWVKYGNHFIKLLRTIRDELYPKLPKESAASNASLLLFIDSIVGGSMSVPDGYMIAE